VTGSRATEKDNFLAWELTGTRGFYHFKRQLITHHKEGQKKEILKRYWKRRTRRWICSLGGLE